MDQAELDALAKDILREAIAETIKWAESGPNNETVKLFHSIEEMPDGELIPTYWGISPDGYGTFLCKYRPLEMVKKIISECDRLYGESLEIVSGGQSGTAELPITDNESNPVSRREIVIMLSYNATRLLLISVAPHLFDTFTELYREVVLGAEVSLKTTLAKLGIDKRQQLPFDVRPYLDSAAERVALRKKERIKWALHRPEWLTERGPGRPQGAGKPASQRAREREDFAAEVENAIRALLSASGEMPTKTAVARELGIGGLNPDTGIDSSLNAFNNKLRRLNINYTEIERNVGLNK